MNIEIHNSYIYLNDIQYGDIEQLEMCELLPNAKIFDVTVYYQTPFRINEYFVYKYGIYKFLSSLPKEATLIIIRRFK